MLNIQFQCPFNSSRLLVLEGLHANFFFEKPDYIKILVVTLKNFGGLSETTIEAVINTGTY